MLPILKWISISLTFGLLGSLHIQAEEALNHSTVQIKNETLSLKKLDETIYEALELFNVPGVAVGIVQDGQLIFARGYGFRDLDNQLPVTEKTLFPIGSCSKAFTAFLMAQLVQEGKVAWDDPVRKYIPEFAVLNAHTSEHLTIRDLLAHRTGMLRHDPIWVFNPLPKSELIAKLQQLSPDFELGQKFEYNNMMYGVAGLIIESVTGQSWEEALSSRLLTPLQMEDSNAWIEEMKKIPNFSLPYAEIDGETKKVAFRQALSTNPGGGINSNVVDMAKWMQLQFPNEKNQSLISKELLLEMQTSQISFSSPIKESKEIYQSDYGLGWFIGKYKSHDLINHAGAIDGFCSEVSLLPKEKIGVVLLSNSGSNGRQCVTYLRNSIFDKLLGFKESEESLLQVLNIRQAYKQEILDSCERHEDANFPAVLKPYVGEYSHPAYGLVKIILKDQKLIFSYGSENISLNPQSDDLFSGKLDLLYIYGVNPIIYFTFVRNASGEIESLHIPFESFRGHAPISFTKI